MDRLGDETHASIPKQHVAAARMLGEHLARRAQPAIGRVNSRRTHIAARTAMAIDQDARGLTSAEGELRLGADDCPGNHPDPSFVAERRMMLSHKHGVGKPIDHVRDWRSRVPVKRPVGASGQSASIPRGA